MNLKHIKVAIAGFFIFLCMLVPAGALEISDLDNPKITEAFVDGLVHPLMKNHQSLSGVISIVKDGKVTFSKGYGFQDLEGRIPVDPAKTLFRPGSISKLFVWVAVMQMVEQGNIDLDGDVNTYLKTFQIKDTFPGQPITMRHIMTHTPGFEESGFGLMTEEGQPQEPMAEKLARLQPGRINPPGTHSSYSNYAASLASLIVANISGLEFTEYVQKNIFDVLGMKSSSFNEPLPENLQKNMAVGYAYGGGAYYEKSFDILGAFTGAGGLSSTANDMTAFTQAIMNGGEYKGGRILKPATVGQMLTRNFSHDDRMMGMALGFYEVEHNGVRLIGHGGDLPVFHSDLKIDLENNIAFYLSFSGTGGATVRSAFVEAFYQTFYPVDVPEITPPTDFSERAAQYGGNYQYWRSGFTTIEKVMKLFSEIAIIPTANNTLRLVAGPFSGEYVEIEENLFREVHSLKKMAFQENDLGEITGFVVDGVPFMSLYKIPTVEKTNFHYIFLALSAVVFLGVFLRLAYQFSVFKALQGVEKKVALSSVIVAGANILTIVMLGLVLMFCLSAFDFEIPLLFRAWLVMPFIIVGLGFYQLYNTILVWRNGLLKSVWARARYSLVTICALFMAWFYYFWNLLGFNYF